MTKIIKYLQEAFFQGTRISRFNLVYASIIGALGHFSLFFVYTLLFPIKWESLPIRSIGVILCIGSLYKLIKPDFLGKFFGLYWHVMLIYVLPFIITLFCLKNDFAEPWLYWEIFMVFVLISFVPHWLIFFLDLVIGISAAILVYLLTTPDGTLIPPESVNVPLYGIVLAFSIIAGYLFNRSNLLSLRYEEQQKAAEKTMVLKAMAGSIAHEMRNPLSQIRYSLDEVLQELSQTRSENAVPLMTESNIDSITKRLAQTQMAVNRGLHVINMTLGSFRDTDVSKSDLACLSAVGITRKAIAEYGYASDQEKTMIAFEPENDFIFLGEENNFTLLLYNLLVNALQVLQSKPDGRIVISLKKGETVNRIFVRDNGPGIPPEILEKIFTPFFTSGKKGGTGLGLAFCKRVMHSFKGDITCNSEQGKYTEFVLEFPVVTTEAIKDYESQVYAEYSEFFKGKKILLASGKPDQQAMIRNMLAPMKIELNEVSNGNKAFQQLIEKQYSLALIDKDLPELDAKALTKKLKANGITAPVSICVNTTKSSLELNDQTSENVLFLPLALHELLSTLKIHIETSLSTVNDSLAGKTVLVVDDLDFNRKVIKSMLNKLGVKIQIMEGSNGLEALEILEKEHCDLLIMDLRMPVLDGFETAKRIRSEKTAFQDIPILVLSGNLDNETLKQTRQYGINECLMKPVKLKPFLQKVTLMLKISKPLV